VSPEETVAAAPVVSVAWALTSTTLALATVDKPEYSKTAAPTSAADVGVTVIVGRVPPPAVIGAVHTLMSVPSEAAKWTSSMYELPAESLTLPAVACAAFQIPTSTTRRSPAVTFDVGVSARLATPRV
jgi:hypothetical protein